jgi:hypothetical protein
VSGNARCWTSNRAGITEQNGEWAVKRAGYMTLETIAPMSNDPIVGLPTAVA